MAESASEQDEVNPAFWLATRAGEMGPPCPLGISRAGPARKKFSLWPYNESLIDRACLVKMAELCPNSFWRFYWPRSTENSKKKDLANIQPLWPHAWSITHISAYVGDSRIQVPQTKPIGRIEAHITNSAVWPVESGTSPRRGLDIIQDYLGFPYMGRHRHVYFNEKSDANQFLRLFSRYHRCRQILRW